MSSAHAILYDCEFLTAPGAPTRFWCGPNDPDQVIAQIGAAKLSLTAPFEILDTFRVLVTPPDRANKLVVLDPLFVRLTGITQDDLDTSGLPLAQALDELDEFSDGATLWSWGKDEFNMIAISCYAAGMAPPMPITRFDNACHLLLNAGMPLEDLHQTRSNTLSKYYDIDHPPLQAHDALGDALCVTYTLQHLLQKGALSAQAFSN
ncbi:MAG: exonuclease [Paracoccaceae bacterium]